MNEDVVISLLDSLRQKGELPYIEVKNSLIDRNKIGETLSALSNSACYHDQEYGYMIWGVEDKTWNVVGTSFDIEKAVRSGQFIYPQIIQALSYKPDLLVQAVLLEGKRLYVVRIRNCNNKPLCFNKIAYIRVGEVNDELNDHPHILKTIINTANDWSAGVPKNSDLQWLDPEALKYLREKYFELENNKGKQLNDIQLLNTLSLIDSDNRPNNTCLLFLGVPSIVKNIFGDRNKITWAYKDELNGIEERLLIVEESLPIIFGIQNILTKINKFNTTLQDIDLFRNDILQYDDKVMEEMIINAVVHRDWNINLWIEIIQTPISLEIRNPGKFRADLNKVLLENKRPEYLNPALAEFLKKMHLMEKEGGGLKKAFTTQIRKGLRIGLRYDNDNDFPRVDFILNGKVTDLEFAQFMFASKDLNQDQVVILDKIYSGKNQLTKDISEDEFNQVKSLVTCSGRGGVSLKLKEHLLKKSKKYIASFSNTHTSAGTSRDIILDYAKKNEEFSTQEIYGILSGKTESWVRVTLKKMADDGTLVRVKRGVYTLVRTIQTK